MNILHLFKRVYYAYFSFLRTSVSSCQVAVQWCLVYTIVLKFSICSYYKQELSKQIEGHTICALGDGAAWPVQVRAT